MADVVRTLGEVLAEADALIRVRLKEIGIEVPHLVVAVTPDGEGSSQQRQSRRVAVVW